MSFVYLDNGEEIDIREVANISTSWYGDDFVIELEFKDYSTKEIKYKEAFSRDYDYEKLKEAFNIHNEVQELYNEPVGRTLF